MPTNKEIVVQFQIQVGKKLKGEAIDLTDYFTEDAQWHLPLSLDKLSNGSEKIGREAVLSLFDGTVAQFYKPESMAFEFHSMLADKNYVHMHFSLSAETMHGKPYKNRYQTLFKLVDGKISEVWEYFDSGIVLALFAEG